jgi:hypothetical protein
MQMSFSIVAKKCRLLTAYVLGVLSVAIVSLFVWIKVEQTQITLRQYVTLAAHLQAQVRFLTGTPCILKLGPPLSLYWDIVDTNSNGIPIRNYPHLYKEDEMFVAAFNSATYRCLSNKPAMMLQEQKGRGSTLEK